LPRDSRRTDRALINHLPDDLREEYIKAKAAVFDKVTAAWAEI
jgi:hypothetical protein